MYMLHKLQKLETMFVIDILLHISSMTIEFR